MTTGVSVIVPSYEAWPILHRTLAAVVHDCRLLAAPWEVLVVDNDSGAEFHRRAGEFVRHNDGVRLVARRDLAGRNFQPGAARNLGVDHARHECLVFLDADCIPAEGLVETYRRLAGGRRDTVFVGHRVFVDSAPVGADELAADRGLLDKLEPVASTSNYGSPVERRMPELLALADHPRPYDCMYACNMAMHRDCLGELRFAAVFDGRWGYEDIELGYRLHEAGRKFRYVPEAAVYHQEGGSLSPADRAAGRRHNFAIADTMIDGFARYRHGISRRGAVPTRSEHGGAGCTSDS
ncbi:glycosyltransferase family 2 protein [Kutzneria kofuensis]|uniref:GT2 family glycosyltransferase n=1 Tax=Kutzneria kofuensis TaxID=103725 RepID=A0A7W9KSV3_9PSEU|nr:glycosyltransferase [Kutzneria kofuensis]MBB5898124.1 GT2 family glycosyltransferase [Kutzneria kofuensis]